MLYPMKLKPCVKETVWGGKRLIKEYGIETDKKNAAEAWVLSCHEEGEDTIKNGVYAGRTLRSVFFEHPEICGLKGESYNKFPVLIKFIDAMDDLSVQVHPDDAYTRLKGKGEGKTEAWYILDCDEGAELILGFKEKISAEEFRSAIEEGNLIDFVQKVKVQKGDLFFIEAGTLHAICKGILLAEVQQSSDTTYRIFDYNRPGLDGKPRQLHVEDALNVTKREPYTFKRQETSKGIKLDGAIRTEMLSCSYFTMHGLEVNGSVILEADETSFISLLVLEGKGSLHWGSETLDVKKGESVFVPAGFGCFTLEGDLKILETEL